MGYRASIPFLAIAAAFVVGCESQETTQTSLDEPTVGMQEETIEPVGPHSGGSGETVSRSWAGYTPRVMDAMSVTEMAYPTGDKRTSAILLHQVMPKEVLRGAEYTYEYHVTNLTTVTHQNVVITSENANNMALISSTPEPMPSGSGLQWLIGDLDPQETRVVRVKASSETLGPASNCVSISYENVMCALTNVVEPDLLLVKTATSDGTVCDDFVLHYVVSNPGSGTAKNIRIRDELPSGLRTTEEKRIVEIAAGDLGPGEQREYTINAKGMETGSHQSIAVARADGGLISESENIQTIIYQPVLAMTVESRDEQYIGRDVEFEFMVRNDGDTDAENTVITADLPANASFVSATSNGTVSRNQVIWQLGAMRPEQSRTVTLRVKATGIGALRTRGVVTAECAETVNATAATSVFGIPAILLEVIDSGDPALIGDTVTYTITATNQGSAADTNIVITCELPPEQDYVRSTGPTTGTLSGRTLAFHPLATLAPGANTSWQVQVRARETGDLRFAVSMTSDELSDPVRETEATRQYE
ncbi:MAG: hypothetical protein ACYTGG_00865 [Planctomycetota bacterium]|jgi:uncharacterized repeat protein (TIGR01451 family)